MRPTRRGGGPDAGQAFPLYITAVAALLFLALVFFAVGQAGATKNGTQTAADAAALAAAQDYRDQLHTGLLAAVGTGGGWAEWLAGRGAEAGRACRAAAAYADLNGARPDITCDEGAEPGSFTVTVTSARAVGKSAVPGTERRHATATAKAVVTPRCTAAPPKAEPPPRPQGTPPPSTPPPDDGQGRPSPGPDPRPGIDLTCGDKALVIDPKRPDAVVRATDLFTVHLAD
ncbi:pilus assembly protein TadG-related protein [Streptomyces sp. NPDC046261]|uniref:pilus assembly protein TadG-related protein n=1 Tax=Streptomyces sp. NPDC046261 TaxID=3157200 RepID=UPI0033D92CE8